MNESGEDTSIETTAVVVVPTPPGKKCNARTRDGTLCEMPAGKGTDHPGQGRCKHHGGCVPIKHGMRSKITRTRIAELIEQYEQDPDPLNILNELARMRALTHDFVERYTEHREALLAWHQERVAEAVINEQPIPRPPQVLDLSAAVALYEAVTRTVERIEKIRALKNVSWDNVHRVIQEMIRIMETHVLDDVTRGKIRAGWMQIAIE